MKYLTTIICLVLVHCLQAQMLLSPFGGVAQNDNDCLSYSMGKIAVTTLQNSANNLTQGFEQPNIRTEETIEIDMPNGIILDDDAGNGIWKIDNIADYPNNEVYILNRWGETLFYAAPYMNDWNGYYNGRALPQATYYYVFYPEKGAKELVKGNLYVLKK